jgi:hypothetical protein
MLVHVRENRRIAEIVGIVFWLGMVVQDVNVNFLPIVVDVDVGRMMARRVFRHSVIFGVPIGLALGFVMVRTLQLH